MVFSPQNRKWYKTANGSAFDLKKNSLMVEMWGVYKPILELSGVSVE